MGRGQKDLLYADIMAVNSGVTGSCNLVIAKLPDSTSIRFCVDCGLFPEADQTNLNTELLFNPEKLDFAILTHNHSDHNGRFPFIVKKGFKNKIYMTDETKILLPSSLNDNCKVLTDIAHRNNTKSLYNYEDVKETLNLTYGCAYEETTRVGENVNVTFFSNGHLPGAAVVLVQIGYPGYESINLLFTGDYNDNNVFFDVKSLPQWVLDLPLTIIQESTYGDMNSTEIVPVFRNNVQKCIKNNGTVIALAYSLGRMQEILYTTKLMQDEGELDPNIPVYCDGKLGISYTNLFQSGKLNIKESMKDFLPRNLTFLDKTTREHVLHSFDSKVIITSSGSGSYGPAQMYLQEYVSDPNTLIHFTGFTPKDSLGSSLKNAEDVSKVKIGGICTVKQATVEYTTEFSAHAKADKMLDFLRQFKQPKLILVNHGEPDTKEKFAEKILDEITAVKKVGVLDRRYMFRVNAYGYVKNLSTKFD